jgi:hypothetical protein
MKKLTFVKIITLVMILGSNVTSAFANSNVGIELPPKHQPTPPGGTEPGHQCGDDPTLPELCPQSFEPQPFSTFIKMIKDSFKQ